MIFLFMLVSCQSMRHLNVTLLDKVKDKEMVHAPGLLLYWIVDNKWLASLQTACTPKSSQENRSNVITQLPKLNSFNINARK